MAIQLAALVLREVAGALFFHLVAQGGVVQGKRFFARGRADVALLGAGVFFVDALFDLCQQLDQLLALFFLLLALFFGRHLAWVELGQVGHLLAQLGQQGGLLLLQGIELALALFKLIAHTGQCGVGHRAAGAALGAVAPSGQRCLGNRLCSFRLLLAARVHQNHLQRGVLEDAIELLGCHKTHTQQHQVHGQRNGQGNRQGGGATQRGRHFHGAAGVGSGPSVSFRSTAMAIGPATVLVSSLSSSSRGASSLGSWGSSSRAVMVP